jgi:hypothetical protein
MLTPALCRCLFVIIALLQSACGDDEDTIDLSHLGERLYGQPDYEFWKNVEFDERSNFEERGPYLQGDLLVPREPARNGMKNEALRWKNGEVPFLIRGRFSE